MSLASRLSRLEAARDVHAVFVVYGLSSEEHEGRMAELIDAGRATPNSLFVCIKKFGKCQHVSTETN